MTRANLSMTVGATENPRYWTCWRHCGNIAEALRSDEDLESNDNSMEENGKCEEDGVDSLFTEVVPWSKAVSHEELEEQKEEAKVDAKRVVKQSSCGGEAGSFQGEEGWPASQNDFSKLHDESEKVSGTLPGRRTRQHGEFNEVIFPAKELRARSARGSAKFSRPSSASCRCCHPAQNSARGIAKTGLRGDVGVERTAT